MKWLRFSEMIRKPPFFLRMETYLRKGDQPIASHPDSPYPRIVPLVVLDYGKIWTKMNQMRQVGRMVLLSIKDMWRGIRAIKKNPRLGQTTISSKLLAELEMYAQSLGIANIGYTKVNPRHIFKGFKILYPNAIVFTIEMDRVKIKTAPSPDSLQEVWRSYYQIGHVVNQVCEFLREHGYNAFPGHAIGGDVNYIPLAIDAGLGYSGKNGLLITPDQGPRIRLAAIFTDITNLPFSQSNPHQWVRDYCDHCNNCIQKCPAKAIFEQPQLNKKGWPVFIDHTKCAIPFSNDNGCTVCIRVCPFSFGDYHQIKKRYENTKR